MVTEQVQTHAGWIEGLTEGDILTFFGIPYASPPINDLRWKPPAPISPWQEVRPTKTFGPRCPQFVGACFTPREDTESEDCLYLNIWTHKDSSNNPVIVWLHGGGFLGGSGSEDAYDGTQLAKKRGYGCKSELSTRGFGYQIAALRWVKDNIKAFGGDPRNVTLMGESAGAVSVRAILCSPLSRGLVQRAILQSAGFEPSVNAAPRTYEQAQNVTQRLFHELRTDDPDALCRVPVEEIKKASHRLCGAPPPKDHVHTPNNLQ